MFQRYFSDLPRLAVHPLSVAPGWRLLKKQAGGNAENETAGVQPAVSLVQFDA